MPYTVCNNIVVDSIEPCFPPETKFDTEKAHCHPNFINPPPNDICVTISNSSNYYESKVVLYKEKKQNLFFDKIATHSIAFKIY